jgi:hypothetical protein
LATGLLFWIVRLAVVDVDVGKYVEVTMCTPRTAAEQLVVLQLPSGAIVSTAVPVMSTELPAASDAIVV